VNSLLKCNKKWRGTLGALAALSYPYMYQHAHRDCIAIATLREAGHSISEIAAQLRVHRSTVTRAIRWPL